MTYFVNVTYKLIGLWYNHINLHKILEAFTSHVIRVFVIIIVIIIVIKYFTGKNIILISSPKQDTDITKGDELNSARTSI